MESNPICSKIRDYKNGNTFALEDLYMQMLPLIKKYAAKSYFMEYEDAFQEYSITLIEAVQKIKTYENDRQSLSYLSTCVRNKFNTLYKTYCVSKQQIESYFENSEIKSVPDPSDAQLFLIDLKSFIEQIDSKTKQKIAILAYWENRDDSEISKILKISRQYVNRIRREISQKLSEQYYY